MKKVLLRGPVQTASGYGVFARSILRALDKTGKYDITLMSVPWGATPLVYSENEEFKRIAELAKKFDPAKMNPQEFDASVQITIPNEFMRLAPKNIGVTAGIEVDRVAPIWIQKSNEMVDALFVPSQHAYQAFVGPQYTNQQGQQLALQRPIHIAPDWIDTSIFNTNPIPDEQQFKFPGQFNFLAMGLGLDRGEGHDRKNFHQLIRWFCEQFKDNGDVGLVLKLSMVNNSAVDYNNVVGRIRMIKSQAGCGQFPRINLIHGRLSDERLAALFKSKSIHAMISLTHGEGYGLPILEAAACGLPVIATDWSGHLDFLTVDGRKLFVPVAYELKEIAQESVWKDVYEPGTKWAWPIEADAKLKMGKVVLSYEKPKEWALELAKHIAETYGKTAEDNFINVFEKIVAGENVASTVVSPKRTSNQQAAAFVGFINELKKKFKVPGKKKLLYTMPQSAGDVYISTGVVKSLKQKFPDHSIVFATSPQFFPILTNNKDIDEVIAWDQWMTNVLVCESVFEEVYTPNLDVQLVTSNWIHGGKGRKLGEEFAHRCDVVFQNPSIAMIRPVEAGSLPEKYIAFHPTSAQGKWSVRGYKRWKEVLSLFPHSIPVVQVGMPDEPLIEGVDVDFRGKHSGYNQFAWLINNCQLVLGVDTISMALAAGLNKPMVTIFGGTYPSKTGPTLLHDTPVRLIETPDRMGCEKACYKEQCFVDENNPCINNIDPQVIADAVVQLLGGK